MPVAVTPVFTNIWQGPANIFINVDLPANGARMAVASDGTPNQVALTTPGVPTVTPIGTAGATAYSYRISALNSGGETLAGTAGTTATGNAVLSVTNLNRLTWAAVPGASSYKVYGRTAAGELFIAQVTGLTYDDTGTVTPAGALPAANTTAGNVNGKWLGTTKGGAKFTATQDVATFEVDESPIPFRNTPTKESCVLEGEFAELLDFARLLLLLPNAVRATGVGFDQIKSGGLSTFLTMPVALIGPTILDPTKFAVLQLYSAYSAGGLVLNIQRKEPNFSPFKFLGQGASNRTAGDQLWTFWQQV